MDGPKLRLSTSSFLLSGPLFLAIIFGAMGTVQTWTSVKPIRLHGKGGAAAAQAGGSSRCKDAQGAKPKTSPTRLTGNRYAGRSRDAASARAGRGSGDSRPVGGIVPWPMPPALVIHTPQVPRRNRELSSIAEEVSNGCFAVPHKRLPT